MRPTVPMDAGRITMPRVLKLPLAMPAAWSFQRWQRSCPVLTAVRSRQKASWASGSEGTLSPSSACQTPMAPREVTSSTASPASSSNCRARWARGWAEAPETASTTGPVPELVPDGRTMAQTSLSTAMGAKGSISSWSWFWSWFWG